MGGTHRPASRARRRAMPSVGTTSTAGAGRRRWCRRGSARRRTGTRRAAGSGGRRVARRAPRAGRRPTISPVTPVLPPKNSVLDRDDPDVVAAEPRDSGPITCAPYSPVRTRPAPCAAGSGPIAASPSAAAERSPVSPAGCAQPGSGRGPRRRPQAKNPLRDTRWPRSTARRTPARRCGPCRCRPRASGSPRRLGGRERPAGHQVVLVGGEHHPPAEHVEEDLLPVLDDVDDRVRPRLGVCRRIAGSVLNC
jgi:hypothetical protein